MGVNWIIQRGRKKQTHLVSDVNYWKSIIAERLTGPIDNSSITLPDGVGLDICDQLASEYGQRVSSMGRTVTQWTLRPRRDNHWFDGLVGCAVLASVEGAQLPGQEAKVAKRTVKASQEIARRRKYA